MHATPTAQWLARFASVMFVSLLTAVASAQTYDAALDWSDTANPNGVWSYNGTTGIPMTTHWDNWDPTSGCCFGPMQPAWAASQWPNPGHVPMWAKVVADPIDPTLDAPVGTVIMHGAEGLNPPELAGITWTSPFSATVRISGGVWLAKKQGRSMDWTIYLNATPITGGNLDSGDAFTSENPFGFEQGTGGAGALVQRVSPGDEITLEFAKTSTFADFVGMELTISESPPCPVLTTLKEAPARDLLATLHRLRDEGLSRTPRGRLYITLFYRHALEASWILTRQPGLRVRTRWLLHRLHPKFRQALAGRPVSLTWSETAAVERLMDAFTSRASPRLRETIRLLRSELRSGRLASELR